MEQVENKGLWNALVMIAIIIGGITAVLASGKEKYLPHLYASTHHAQPHEGSGTTDSMYVETEKAKDSSQINSAEIVVENQSTSFSLGEYVLVAGSFLTKAHATAFQNDIVGKLGDVAPEVVATTKEEKTYYRVVVLRSPKWIEIKNLKDKLNNAGYPEVWAFKEQ
jgi:hypothetical protein